MIAPLPHPERTAALRRFYREVDAVLVAGGRSCRGCGRCCRFDEAEHRLYASRLERDYLLESVAPFTPAEEGESEHSVELLAAGLRCPFQKEGRCLAREGRALGCRLFFCSGLDDGLSEHWHQRLKHLHRDLGLEWDYAPLLPLRKR
ncbi:MAG: YkgJ family cysteine cluster protein [Planctomycetota bacterium]|jgi:Fe-S-cluster containining protein|nr:YkgJ family cysteine cluster protein [Planctomycetota bacterium]